MVIWPSAYEAFNVFGKVPRNAFPLTQRQHDATTRQTGLGLEGCRDKTVGVVLRYPLMTASHTQPPQRERLAGGGDPPGSALCGA
jgi:hypothetical protein